MTTAEAGSAWLALKFNEDATYLGVRRAATRLRKFGVPVVVAQAVCSVALASRPVECDYDNNPPPRQSQWFPK